MNMVWLQEVLLEPARVAEPDLIRPISTGTAEGISVQQWALTVTTSAHRCQPDTSTPSNIYSHTYIQTHKTQYL